MELDCQGSGRLVSGIRIHCIAIVCCQGFQLPSCFFSPFSAKEEASASVAWRLGSGMYMCQEMIDVPRARQSCESDRTAYGITYRTYIRGGGNGNVGEFFALGNGALCAVIA